MQIGILAIGIEDYENASYRRSDFRLKYAVEDVLTFVTYADAAWSGAAARNVIPLIDRKATRGGFEEAVAALSGSSLDVFVLYLAGHGAHDAQGVSWFCLADAVPGKPSLTAPVLDAALEKIGARQTILILDCCYAAAVLIGSKFFSSLENSISRLFICSSREDQRAWEDDSLRHGIFSNVLINGLSSTSPLADAKGFVDLESSLFPYLCEQVPRLVFSKKSRQLQEPTKGGVSAGPTRFPTTSAKLLGRQISAYQAVRSSFLKWLRRTFVTLVALLIFSDATTYHLAIGANGIEVRSGLIFADPLRRMLPGGVVETGFTADNLDPSDPKRPQVVKLLEGRIWGFRLHDHDRWIDRLLPLLVEDEQQMTQVFLGNGVASDAAGPSSAQPPSKDVPLSPIVIARAALAGNDFSLFDWSSSLESTLPTAEGLSCHSDVRNVVDFTLLGPGGGVIADDIRRLVLGSVSDPMKAYDRLVDAAKIIDYRRFKNHGGAAPVEQLALVREASYIISKSGHAPPIAKLDSLQGLDSTWCNGATKLLILVLGDQQTRIKEEKRLTDLIITFDVAKQGDTLTYSQEDALNTLAAAAVVNPLPEKTIEAVAKILESDSRGLEGTPQLVDWLQQIAEHQQLPPPAVGFLQRELRRPAGDYDFHQLIAFFILTRNAHYLPREAIRELVDWSRLNLQNYRTVGDYAEGVGFLALVANVGSEFADVFAQRLVPEIPIPVEQNQETERGVTVIRSNDFKQGVALGRLAQVMALPNQVVDKLSKFALARRGIPDYDQVLIGLGVQRFGTGLKNLRDRLLADLSDATRRMLDVEIASQSAPTFDASDRRATLDSLRTSWSREREPVVKIALGEIIAKLALQPIGIRILNPTNCRCTERSWRISTESN